MISEVVFFFPVACLVHSVINGYFPRQLDSVNSDFTPSIKPLRFSVLQKFKKNCTL